ncbi:MAG: transcriptional regulator GcvA [Alphaproteobacteria bacterium]|nr:transcriptional regulator GcvA [Alphaproteobacteria bacterium]
MAVIPGTQALRCFEAAARHLSFQQAAAELNLTPGAVSRQIQTLEAMLNARLFQRHNRRVALTRVGREYLDEIRGPLAQLAAATVRVQSGTNEGALSICAYPSFAVRWFIPRWGRFFDLHPEIDVRLTTSMTPVDFARDDYDLAIQVLREGETPPGQAAHKVIEVETMPVCAPALAAMLRRPQDLSAVTLLHGEPRPQDWSRWLRFAGVTGVDAEKGLRFESLNLSIQAAIEGLGVAIGIEALVRDDLQQGRLVQPFAPVRRSSRPMYLVYPQAKAANPRLAAFCDWLLAEAAA